MYCYCEVNIIHVCLRVSTHFELLYKCAHYKHSASQLSKHVK